MLKKSCLLLIEKDDTINSLIGLHQKFLKKISILELNGFSERRKMRRNNTKLIATVIFSQDPESSALRGPAIKIRIFEKQDTQKWNIDLICFRTNLYEIHRDLNFVEFINEERVKIMRDFLWE